MTQRLPIPGQDDGTWGEILNGFLGVEHNSDGTLKIRTDGTVAPLVSGKLPAANLPSFIPTTNLGSGTASSTNYLRGDGTWSVPSGTAASNATTSVPGLVQLTGDLGGVATAPTVPGLAAKANTSSLSTVATSGSYTDLSNKPTIPAAQVNSDWNASTGVAQVLNKPTLSTVATTGSYTDLSNKPTIPTVSDATTNAKGVVQLAGDLAGTALLPTVAKVNGVAVSGMPTNGQVLTATSSTAASWATTTGLTVNVKNYGAKIDGAKLSGVTCSSGSASVSFTSASFNSGDVGKLFIAFGADNYGTVTTIQSVTDATHIVLAANAGVTLNTTPDSNGYYTSFAIYGTDDAASIQSALNGAAAGIPAIAGFNAERQNAAGGSPKVVVSGSTSTQGWALLGSAITVPSGVTLESEVSFANFTSSASAPCIIFNEWTFSVGSLILDCLNNGGLALGPTTLLPSHNAHVRADNIEIYRPGASAVGLTLTGNWFRITSLTIHDALFQGVQHSSGSDFWCGQAFFIGCTSPVVLNSSGQVAYERVFMDTCIATAGGFTLNNGCKNIRANIQAFENYSNTMDSIVSIGQSDTNMNFDLNFDVTANSTGGAILKLAHAAESRFTLIGSNSIINSTYNSATPITTGIIYGTGNSGTITIDMTLTNTISNYTGSLVGSLHNTQGSSFAVASDFATSKSVQIGTGTPDLGGGQGVLSLKTATTVPSSNATSSIVAYNQNNVLKYRNTAGTVQRISMRQEEQHGFVALSMDPVVATATVAPTAGVLQLTKLFIPENTTVTNIVLYIATTAGNTLANSYVGLYDSTGVLLSGSADQSTTWTSLSTRTSALITPQTVTAGYYYAGFMVGSATTVPTFARSSNGIAANMNLLGGVNYRFGTYGTGLTALPSSLTLASIGAGQACFLIGVS